MSNVTSKFSTVIMVEIIDMYCRIRKACMCMVYLLAVCY